MIQVNLSLYIHGLCLYDRSHTPGSCGGVKCVSDLFTELRKQEETGQLVQPVLFVLLVLLSVLLYFAVSLMDPGFILSDGTDLQVSTSLLYITVITPTFYLCVVMVSGFEAA